MDYTHCQLCGTPLELEDDRCMCMELDVRCDHCKPVCCHDCAKPIYYDNDPEYGYACKDHVDKYRLYNPKQQLSMVCKCDRIPPKRSRPETCCNQ